MSANELRRIARRAEPMFNAPVVVLGLIVVLIGIYAAFNWAPVAIQDRVIRDYAFIPGRLTIAIWPDRLVDLLKRVNTDPAALQQARQIRELQVLGGGAKPWTLLTYAFLHGSWTHVLLELRVAGRVRAADRAPVRLGEVSSVHGGDRNRQRARPLDRSRRWISPRSSARRERIPASWARRPGSCFNLERPLGAFGSISRPQIETIPAASLQRRLYRASLAHLHFHLVRNEHHFRRRSANARLFRHAGCLGRPSRRLYRGARAVSAVRSPVPRAADEPESLRPTRAPSRPDFARRASPDPALR